MLEGPRRWAERLKADAQISILGDYETVMPFTANGKAGQSGVGAFLGMSFLRGLKTAGRSPEGGWSSMSTE